MSLMQKFDTMRRRHTELSALLGLAKTAEDPVEYARLSKEYSDLDPLVEAWLEYCRLEQEAKETKTLLDDPEIDPEMKRMVREELDTLQLQLEQKVPELQLLLAPKDPHEGRNVILEIRAGTGGEEAGLFAADLLRMYGRFAEQNKWRVEHLSISATQLGGFKEVIAMVSGKGAWSAFKYESGVHRVQRVPTTEAGGRIHTSACTVAVLPEADEVEVTINERDDLRIDVFRSSGPGGQSVNTTDSAVRITHLPTGMVVICQDEKSQLKNKAQALKVLKARLLDLEQRAANDERSRDRRDQVGSGDRSERIRTYNFPQNRVTDHRINFTLHKLDQVMEGDLQEIVTTLTAYHQAEILAQMGKEQGG
ncbi:MAG: peptide chain release factor 1 [Magnetococcales bacterium]|nr:peptide chain release factor 1 [Magnetococcales bacterium]MBF0439522.1 peptide chain release factor 1 [Magnetococcales bacterium]